MYKNYVSDSFILKFIDKITFTVVGMSYLMYCKQYINYRARKMREYVRNFEHLMFWSRNTSKFKVNPVQSHYINHKQEPTKVFHIYLLYIWYSDSPKLKRQKLNNFAPVLE